MIDNVFLILFENNFKDKKFLNSLKNINKFLYLLNKEYKIDKYLSAIYLKEYLNFLAIDINTLKEDFTNYKYLNYNKEYHKNNNLYFIEYIYFIKDYINEFEMDYIYKPLIGKQDKVLLNINDKFNPVYNIFKLKNKFKNENLFIRREWFYIIRRIRKSFINNDNLFILIG